MTTELMLKLTDHATGTTPWTPPAQWYFAYFLDGVEISGGSYSRQPIDFATAVALSDSQVRAGSSTVENFPNPPTTNTDEARIVNTASGAITLTGWIFPYLRSLTAGVGVSHDADSIAVGLTSS